MSTTHTNLIDEQVKKAISEGQLENLPGKGEPIAADPFAGLPEEIRNTFRILKNAGFAPPEVEKNKEIAVLKRQLDELPEGSEEAKLVRRKIAIREIEFAMATERLKKMTSGR